MSVRAIAALLTSLVFSLWGWPWFIAKSKLFFRSKARPFTPDNHREKDDMPTMGGVFIVLMVTAVCLLWCNLLVKEVWVFLLGMLGFGAIGCLDDWYKIKYDAGISATAKVVSQLCVSFLVAWLLVYWVHISTIISFPFFKTIQPDIGVWFIPWAMLVIVGCSNAVNLTDGLDGLAIGSLIPNFAIFSVICFLAGNFVIASYLAIPFINTAEVSVIGSTLVGASLSFLWYNTYPAQIFMGDVGSLSLGACLALMALMAKQELLLIISGGLFVGEALSVIIQVVARKKWDKRVFRMAPIHHHFELLGWPESKITVRFGIISLVLCLLALVTLKLR